MIFVATKNGLVGQKKNFPSCSSGDVLDPRSEINIPDPQHRFFKYLLTC
jgi:hypothetical protein